MTRRSDGRRLEGPEVPAIVLVAGDADDIVEMIRSGALSSGARVIDADDPRADPEGLAALATLAVVAVRQGEERSGLAQGLTHIENVRHRTAPRAVAIVIVIRGAARIAPRQLARLLGPEILYQLRYSMESRAQHRVWRTARLRVGEAALTAAGIRVFRAAPTAQEGSA